MKNRKMIKVMMGILAVALIFTACGGSDGGQGGVNPEKLEYFSKMIGPDYEYYGYQANLPESKLRINKEFSNEAEAEEIAEKLTGEIQKIIQLDKDALKRFVNSESVTDEDISEGYNLMINSASYAKIKNAFEKANFQTKAYYLGKDDYEEDTYTAIVVIRGGILATELDYMRLTTKINIAQSFDEFTVMAKEYDKLFEKTLSLMENQKYHTQDFVINLEFKLNNDEIEFIDVHRRGGIIEGVCELLLDYVYTKNKVSTVEGFEPVYPYVSGTDMSSIGYYLEVDKSNIYNDYTEEFDKLNESLERYKSEIEAAIDINGLKINENSYNTRAYDSKYNAKLIDKFGYNRLGLLISTSGYPQGEYYESYFYSPLEMAALVNLFTYTEEEVDMLGVPVKVAPRFEPMADFYSSYDKYIDQSDGIISGFLPRYEITYAYQNYMASLPIYRSYDYSYINYFTG